MAPAAFASPSPVPPSAGSLALFKTACCSSAAASRSQRRRQLEVDDHFCGTPVALRRLRSERGECSERRALVASSCQDVDGESLATAHTRPTPRRRMLAAVARAAGALVVAAEALPSPARAAFGMGASYSKVIKKLGPVDFLIEYPTGWKQRSNTQRSGYVVGEFQNGDVAYVNKGPEVKGANSIEELGTPEEVFRSYGSLLIQRDILGDDRNADVRTAARAERDGRVYYTAVLEFETVTVSGYRVARRCTVSAAVFGGYIFAAAASSSEGRWGEAKPALQHIADSFRIFPAAASAAASSADADFLRSGSR